MRGDEVRHRHPGDAFGFGGDRDTVKAFLKRGGLDLLFSGERKRLSNDGGAALAGRVSCPCVGRIRSPGK